MDLFGSASATRLSNLAQRSALALRLTTACEMRKALSEIANAASEPRLHNGLSWNQSGPMSRMAITPVGGDKPRI